MSKSLKEADPLCVMPEEDLIGKYSAGMRQFLGLLLDQFEKERQALKEQLAEKDRHNQSLEEKVKELQEICTRAQRLDFVTHPTLLVDDKNSITFTNEKLCTLLKLPVDQILRQPLENYVRGLEFLGQISEQPLLMQVERLETLANIPVALHVPEQLELPQIADIKFLEPPGDYHGVKIDFKPVKEVSSFRGFGRFIARSIGRRNNKYDRFDAFTYSMSSHLTVREKDVQESSTPDGTKLLTEITLKVLQVDQLDGDVSDRSVVVDLSKIVDADARFYTTLTTVSKMKGRPLVCIVPEDSPVYASLISAGYAKEKIIVPKLKKK